MAEAVGEPLVSIRKAEHGFDLVVVVQAQHHRADDIVQPRAQPAAGDDAALELGGVEVDLGARPGLFKCRQTASLRYEPVDGVQAGGHQHAIPVFQKVNAFDGRVDPALPQPLDVKLLRNQMH
jgi:hypothetical protein